MNILINGYCNLHCPYCFADPTMQEHDDCQNMSEEDFKTALKYNKIFGSRQLRIIGGEPTLSPNFIKYVEMGVNDPFFDNILIFSNYTFTKEIAQKLVELSQYKQINLLPNINEFELMIPKYRDVIMWNLDYHSTHLPGFNCIGINVYRPDMDLTLWKNLILQYPQISSLRYSIAVPSKQVLENDFDFYEYYHSFQRILLELNQFAAEHDMEVHCDCNNVPPCCYDGEAVKELFKGSISSMMSDRYVCGYPVVDCAPDLSVIPCFGSGSKLGNHKLTEFETEQELIDCFMNEVKPFDDRYIARKECLNCVRYKRTGVSCSCRSCHMVDKEEILNAESCS